MNAKDFSPETTIFLNELNNDPRWHKLRSELKCPTLPTYMKGADMNDWILASGKKQQFEFLMKLLFKGE